MEGRTCNIFASAQRYVYVMGDVLAAVVTETNLVEDVSSALRALATGAIKCSFTTSFVSVCKNSTSPGFSNSLIHV